MVGWRILITDQWRSQAVVTIAIQGAGTLFAVLRSPR